MSSWKQRGTDDGTVTSLLFPVTSLLVKEVNILALVTRLSSLRRKIRSSSPVPGAPSLQDGVHLALVPAHGLHRLGRRPLSSRVQYRTMLSSLRLKMYD